MADVDKQVHVQHYRKNSDGEIRRYFRSGDNSFIPSVHGGMTIVSIGGNFGVAMCSNKDSFCYKTGYNVALERAKIATPDVSCSC